MEFFAHLAKTDPAYLELLRKSVEEALDTPELYNHGTLYQDDMKDFVRQKLGNDDGIREKFLGTFSFTDPSYDELKALTDQIRSSPRGTWAIYQVEYSHRPGETFYKPRISAGGGELGAHSDTYPTPPDFEKVRDRMVGYEVYKMRGQIENERSLAANRKALQDLKLHQGQSFKDVNLAGEKPFSTITVVGLDMETGEASFVAKRRGTAKRYHFSAGGEFLARYLPQPQKVESFLKEGLFG